MNELTKQFKELQDKAVRYDNLIARNREFAQRLRDIIKAIEGLIGDIDPYSTMCGRKNQNYKEILAEIQDKMNHGLSVSINLIETSYCLDERKAYYIFNKLKSKSGNMVRTEGKRSFLYVQKEI